MTATAPRLALAAALALAALALAGCGAGSLSSQQLRSRATRICHAAGRRTDAIKPPTGPTQGARFINQGIATLEPQRRALHRLRAPGDLQQDYRAALAAFDQELAAMRAAQKGLKDGNDPVVAIKTLQEQLAPTELQAARAWRALDVPACTSLTA